MEINNSIEDIDINFLCSKNEVLKKWLRNFPLSVRTNVKNILSIDSEIDTKTCFLVVFHNSS